MNVCRFCLCRDNDKILPILDHKIENIATKILDFLSIDILEDDKLPKSACDECIDKILQWEIFVNNCQKSNAILYNNIIFGCTLSESILDLDIVEIIKEENSQIKKCNKDNVEEYMFLEEEENDKLDSFNDFSDLPDLPLEENLKFYECDICPLNFDNCFEFLDHQQEHTGPNIFMCDKCTEAFSTRDEIVHHDRNHRISCKLCGKLVLKGSMKLHLIKHTDRHKCPQCKSCFSSKAALGQHIITVHTDIREHICEVCGKSFSSLSSIRVHRKTHSEDRKYPCMKCNYAARTASALYIHRSTHENDLCICEVCSKVFKSNRNLTDHIRRVHSEIKKHCCNYCTKSFVDKYMLKVHLRWHTNVRPYKCPHCAKSFIRADGLKEHINTHGQRKLIECIKCTRKFTSRQGKAKHNCLAVP